MSTPGERDSRHPEPTEEASRPAVLEAARGVGVMLGGPIALLAIAIAGVASAVAALRHRRAPGLPAVAICGAIAAYLKLIRPWHLRWGSTPDDTARALPGDELLPAEGTDIVHAITIDAPRSAVWPWVAQLGQDRGGFYSYEWLENLAGCRMRNAEEIHPEWQEREVGETLYLHPSSGLAVTVFDPPRALGLEGWGTIVLEPLDADRTRLIVRSRMARGAVATAYAALLEVPHFVMERKMLLGIKDRAERARTVPTTNHGGSDE